MHWTIPLDSQVVSGTGRASKSKFGKCRKQKIYGVPSWVTTGPSNLVIGATALLFEPMTAAR